MTTTKTEAGQPLTLSTKEAAAMVPMGVRQLREAVDRGEIPAVRLGRNIRIPRAKFLALINGEEDK
ncbi:helix-turn-helix domain-containing protein [Brevibacterium salitolerans]|uniref:Helix-turn-helix domain-containing protein n=1 Tax=Brevibacterium salitolerans TaxID=1403566 RepID=A0ABN2WHH8_9MICO